MIYAVFAHAGEHHESTVQAAEHAAQGITVNTSLLFWLTLIIAPIALLLILRVCKAKASTSLLTLSIFLIIFSIISYQVPGTYSIVALSVGFAIVLLLSIAGLSANE